MKKTTGELKEKPSNASTAGERITFAEYRPVVTRGALLYFLIVTNEAFAGIRAVLNGTYAWLTQDNLDAISGTSNATWRTMLFALSFMHTVVQERRKFGALGFNIPYEFSQADLSASIQFIQNHITVVDSKKRPVDWSTVNYMGCAEQYGGKITDGFDEVRTRVKASDSSP
ncbi:flagellar outer dynein arm heavy chain gamma [Chrysochromulina tobinii]|uniref:Flagellar outer dynein arm heavy chain gamma n=1 Tax=Chrysochromulina tobinii TaxID=1460289 RepID=A0A0M0LPR2_9EUKA|nr:flagellar outer dynein arm heavy chain gamma [Chrysochromulina tobinii]|eukprot:KOO53014.1 flagellar outer dynein arm heavy chain gamma [Chrysochromulina sp. CCMP291]